MSIDDFGTGYSSLSPSQVPLPVSELKIDRSFMREISTAPTIRSWSDHRHDRPRVRLLGGLPRGIETDAQLRRPAPPGCDQGQGYLFPGRWAGGLRARLCGRADVGG